MAGPAACQDREKEMNYQFPPCMRGYSELDLQPEGQKRCLKPELMIFPLQKPHHQRNVVHSLWHHDAKHWIGEVKPGEYGRHLPSPRCCTVMMLCMKPFRLACVNHLSLPPK